MRNRVRRGLPLRFCVLHAHHLHVEQLLDRPADVVLAGQPVDLEGVGVVSRLALCMPFSVTSGRRMIWCGSKFKLRFRDVSGHGLVLLLVCAQRCLLRRCGLLAEGVQRRLGHQHPLRATARPGRSARPPAAPTRRPCCGRSCTHSRRSRPPPPAASAPSSFSALRIAAISLVFGASNAKLVDQRDLVVGDLARPRAIRVASRTAFFGRRYDQSRGRLAKM